MVVGVRVAVSCKVGVVDGGGAVGEGEAVLVGVNVGDGVSVEVGLGTIVSVTVGGDVAVNDGTCVAVEVVVGVGLIV